MKALSASSNSADPYRAGLELGTALKACSPEVVLLFATIHFAEEEELIEGIYDALDNDNLILIGNTGDGYYESKGPGDVGVAALGLNSEGKVRWLIHHSTGITANPMAVTEQLLSLVQSDLGARCAQFSYFISDFHADASQIEKVLERHRAWPIVGGFAADDNQMSSCRLYCNREVLADAAIMLSAVGEVAFSISIGNSITPVGQPGMIESSSGTTIHQIDGICATRFVERETGKPVLQSDSGVTSLSILDVDDSQIKRLRSIVPQLSRTDRDVGLYGGIETGKMVQVCVAEPEEIIREVYQIAAREKERGREAVAAIIVSCAGRKWLLGDKIHHEIDAVVGQFGRELPLVGFPSFGEIGPLRTKEGYSRNLFHNMTYVLLLLFH